MTRSRALWLMIAVLLVAGVLRLPQLESAPPGLHYDEAANVILAADIGVRGERPVFIESYTGKEVLFFYLAGGLMNVVGPSYTVLRLTAAILGLLTVAATYWLGRELLADRRVAVIAAALLAVSFWHLVFSRLGFRAISQPLLQALTMACLFRAFKETEGKGAVTWYVLSGLFLGLTAYTYLAARLFPLLVLAALIPMLLAPAGRGKRIGLLLLTALVALLVLAPLLFYFVQNPESFWVRIAQVAPESGAEETLSLWESLLRASGMFFLSGDPYWRFNIPGRPLFNWFWGGLLLVGWIVALLRWRRWWYPWQKGAVLMLLVAPFVMVLPTALAVGEIVPSNLRAIGLIPFVFYLPALGLVTLVEQLAELIRCPGASLTAYLRSLNFLEGYDVNYAFLVLLILLLDGAFGWRDYFDSWATRTDLFYSSDADLAAVARYLDEEAPPDLPLYVAALHYRHPTVAALSENYERVRWLTESDAFVLPEEGGALYIYPHNSPAPDWVRPFLAEAQRSVGPEGPDGQPLYEAYLLRSDAHVDMPPGATISSGSFGALAQPLWVEVDEAGAEQHVEATFAWRVEENTGRPLRLFAQLYDIWGQRWGQTEVLSYAAEQWRAGERVMQRLRVPIMAGAPPGNYRLHLGFFDEASGARVARLDEEGRYAGGALIIDDVTLGYLAPPRAQPEAPNGRPQQVRDGLTLLGYALGAEVVETGATLPLGLWWWATEEQPPMTVRLELLRNDNTGHILLNTRPVRGTYPFENWMTPLFLRDVVDPQIPVNLAGGEYRLHLRLLTAEGQSLFTSSLGTIVVQETERIFEAPPLQQRLAASFAREIDLLGYNLQRTTTGQYSLQLAWRARRAVESDYTVFVHLLREDGSCCLWQNDAMPRQGAYPTTRWIEGEVVLDEVLIAVPEDVAAGDYALEVGLYLAESGQRLTVMQPGQEPVDALRLTTITLP